MGFCEEWLEATDDAREIAGKGTRVDMFRHIDNVE
jgi:hypothetical protein